MSNSIQELVSELRDYEKWLKQNEEYSRRAKTTNEKAAYQRQRDFLLREIKRLKQAIVDQKAGRGDKEKKKDRKS